MRWKRFSRSPLTVFATPRSSVTPSSGWRILPATACRCIWAAIWDFGVWRPLSPISCSARYFRKTYTTDVCHLSPSTRRHDCVIFSQMIRAMSVSSPPPELVWRRRPEIILQYTQTNPRDQTNFSLKCWLLFVNFFSVLLLGWWHISINLQICFTINTWKMLFETMHRSDAGAVEYYC